MDTKISPKDVFLHLLAIITLYASAIAFSVLLFNYIDLLFPRNLNGNVFYQNEGLRDSIRFAVSALIVVFPVFFFTSRSLRKAYEADQSRINLTIRKWVSYFTMFLAGGIGIGWLVRVIYRFLDGDFTTAFLLKALTIFFVTGSVFFYYRAVTRGEEARQSVRGFAYVVGAIVSAAIIAAFFMVGSPEDRRLQAQDTERVNDLSMIQNYIGEHYRVKSSLPSSLEELNDDFRGVRIPKDPVTGNDYEYSRKDADTFEICAEFALPWSLSDGNYRKEALDIARPSGGYYFGPSGETWQHPAGRYCFERNIDPDYFKPITAR